jgi:ADP-ribose pyrophosphatase YjhB (NUDIX family)
MNSQIDSFNIRVYALIIEDNNILISKELINGEIVLKFPGGGVEYGEGIVDALQREAQEELSQELKEIEHFYTTDFFQESSFRKNDQLVSVYYKASLSKKLINKIDKPIKDQPVFIWENINNLKKENLHFPIDKKVLQMIKNLNQRLPV